MKRHNNGGDAAEPLVDPSQDYELLLGYENSTHTVLRFKRKLDTCDYSHDVAITVSTHTSSAMTTRLFTQSRGEALAGSRSAQLSFMLTRGFFSIETVIWNKHVLSLFRYVRRL